MIFLLNKALLDGVLQCSRSPQHARNVGSNLRWWVQLKQLEVCCLQRLWRCMTGRISYRDKRKCVTSNVHCNKAFAEVDLCWMWAYELGKSDSFTRRIHPSAEPKQECCLRKARKVTNVHLHLVGVAPCCVSFVWVTPEDFWISRTGCHWSSGEEIIDRD